MVARVILHGVSNKVIAGETSAWRLATERQFVATHGSQLVQASPSLPAAWAVRATPPWPHIFPVGQRGCEARNL